MNEIRFIDLFSGIGGFRLGLEKTNDISPKQFSAQSGGWNENEEKIPNGHSSRTSRQSRTYPTELRYRCVWSCDNNKYANQVYANRFGEINHYTDDIRRVDPTEIPDFDLLCAGFPCQSFSVAGKRKGFQDTRGTLFFEILRVAEAKRPHLLLLENVKGLLNHDRGRTFTVILQALDELGYWIEWQVLNSKHFGVPQNRERVFIVGHLRGSGGREIFPIAEDDKIPSRTEESNTAGSLSGGAHSGGLHSDMTILQVKRHRANGNHMIRFYENEVPTLTQQMGLGGGNVPLTIATIPEEDRPSGNYLPRERILSKDGISRAVSTLENQHPWYESNTRIRRLTPVECERLQGFPDGWTEGISDTQRYKGLGNAVTVNVIEFLGRKIRSSLSSTKKVSDSPKKHVSDTY